MLYPDDGRETGRTVSARANLDDGRHCADELAAQDWMDGGGVECGDHGNCRRKAWS